MKKNHSFRFIPKRQTGHFLYLDPSSGIAGDMFLGAMVDLGVEIDRLRNVLSGLRLPGWKLRKQRVLRCGLTGCKVDVVTQNDVVPDKRHTHSKRELKHGRHHDHDHNHGHDHPQDSRRHDHDHGHRQSHAHHSFTDIRRLLKRSSLPRLVKEKSEAVFAALAEAEGKLHGKPPAKVTFHEVGAIDSIIDIVGVCAGLDLLGVSEVRSGPPAIGSGGSVRCAHGSLPIPAPATLELLRDVPVNPLNIAAELTTPTGAALLKTLCTDFGPPPPMIVKRIGYGAGTKEFPGLPNLLRIRLACRTQIAGHVENDLIAELQTNLDDVSPQCLGYLMEKLLALGAADVSYAHLTMKKSRPGFLLTVLCAPQLVESIADCVFQETGAFGLRLACKERLILAREHLSTKTPYGPVNLKIGSRGTKKHIAQPEYEDCKTLAQLSGLPLRKIQKAAKSAAQLNRH
jgi:hypothetical protein